MPDIELHHGDALRFLRDIPSGSVDAVITDPPYSSGGFTRGDRTLTTKAKYVSTGVKETRESFGGDSRDQRSWMYWCALWIGECHRILKPSGYFLTFVDWRQLPQMTDAVQAGGIVWRGIVPWDKGQGARGPHKGYFRHQCEYVVWGTRGVSKVATHSGPWPGFYRYEGDSGDETPDPLEPSYTYPVKQSEKFHQTGKPPKLMRDLLACVVPGGTVLDPFMGSGTTLSEAVKLGLNVIGIEEGADNFAFARERINRAISGPSRSLFEATQEAIVFRPSETEVQ